MAGNAFKRSLTDVFDRNLSISADCREGWFVVNWRLISAGCNEGIVFWLVGNGRLFFWPEFEEFSVPLVSAANLSSKNCFQNILVSY